VIGALVALLTTLKGCRWRTTATSGGQAGPVRRGPDAARGAAVLAAMVPRLTFRTRRMAAAADGLLLATDVADVLVERGVPFREAHEIVGGLVRHCVATGTRLRDLDAKTLRGHSPLLTPALVRGLTPQRSVARRRVVGGTAPTEVLRQLARAEREDGR
jgi:argininosuccinate lyase